MSLEQTPVCLVLWDTVQWSVGVQNSLASMAMSLLGRNHDPEELLNLTTVTMPRRQERDAHTLELMKIPDNNPALPLFHPPQSPRTRQSVKWSCVNSLTRQTCWALRGEGLDCCGSLTGPQSRVLTVDYGV